MIEKNGMFIPDADSVLTARELIEILQKAAPDAEIVVDLGERPDCDESCIDYIAAVEIGKNLIRFRLQQGMDISNLY